MNKWQHHIYLRMKNINNWHISVNIGLKGVKKEDENKFLKKYKKKKLLKMFIRILSFEKKCQPLQLFWQCMFVHLLHHRLSNLPSSKNEDSRNPRLHCKMECLFKVAYTPLGKGNLIFCCTGSRENYFGSVGRQNYNNNPKFQGRHI